MKRVLRAFVLVLVLAFSRHADAATYQVTNTADTGAGSLREAIAQVNGNPGPHLIIFAIQASGVQTIHLGSPLPEITTTVAIDGTTQPSYNQMPLIEVAGDASNLPFTIAAPNSRVSGLALNNFANHCLYITADACTVSSCFIGTNANGSGAIPNGDVGIYVIGKRTLIGGRGPAFRNVISGNIVGVYIDAASEQDTVIGNYIGTDATGNVAIPNQQGILSTARNVLIENNLISGNTYDGIFVDCPGGPVTPAEGTRIFRNRIGTDVSGTRKLGNGENGIKLICDYNVVGGIGKGNVISGNGMVGIYVLGAHYNQILGNYIGVSYDGALPLGNSSSGIYLPFAHDNVIGGSTADGTGNIIGGNGGSGITIQNTLASDNTIQGNAIGTSFNGALSLGNVGAGIGTGGDRTTVGGLGTLGNIIANNYGGVLINSVQSTVRGNSIFGNSFGGIDLQPFFLSPNDTLDADEGGNHLQNFPTISSVSQLGNQARLQGYLSSMPNHSFTLDFYSNTACDADGHGEGETWLGSVDVITNGSGVTSFDVPYPFSSLRGGYIFTATATDDEGNTSEFSSCVPLGFTPTAAEPGPFSFAMGASTPSPARGTITLPFTLPVPSRVSLRAYDVSGRLVSTLVEADYSAGVQRAEWSVEHVPAGLYFCRLQARANNGFGQIFEASRTVVVVR